MIENIRPSEFLEAQDRREEYGKRREEAEFYRVFLDQLQDKMEDKAKSTLAASEFPNQDPDEVVLRSFDTSFSDLIKSARAEAQKITGKSFPVDVDFEGLGNMKIKEFKKHIEERKSSLAK